ncbi:2-hydroxyacid dehydrogenase [Arthrobacter sp. AB6]|uniref:2-hydroxyacid dehydrogenase n=1 Tax=Arthrobacter sp. AB6 TaxID=2962570 RepID=UPI0028823A08|nr:2-hydroxyacid dehydrogenase [Arthrobacter sp. AB6]MDT0196754.1 2-hydroxyacid dehydrogenase [Arthrobacter sp. AB6]
MKKVVVTDPDVWPWLQDMDDRLRLVFIPLDDTEELNRELADAWAYVGVFLDEQHARSVGPNFELAQICAAGTEHIASRFLPAGVTVANAAGHGKSIAEHVLMVTLAVRRQLLNVDRGLRAGQWANKIVNPAAAPAFTTLEGSVVGIVGFGHTGRAIARLCRAVGMRVIAVNRTPASGDPDADWVKAMDALPELLEQADTLVLACPLTDSTKGLIGTTELRTLGPAGVLVNVARGPVVDEVALYEALKDHNIAGAAIDVWYRPVSTQASAPSELPFAELDNIVMTPHYSATATDTYRERGQDVRISLFEALNGLPVSRRVTTTTGGGGRA